VAENGKIRMPISDNPSLFPPVGSFYLWLSPEGFFKKMDSAGNVTNLSAQSVNDLVDVDLTGLEDGQMLVWDAVAQLWKPSDVPSGNGGGTVEGGGLTPVEVDLSVTPNIALENGKAYLIKPDSSNASNNTVYLPAGESKDKLLILDIDSSFGSHPVTVMGAVDGFTGIRMDVDHSWIEFYYHEGDSEWKTQDPYASSGGGSGGGYTAPEICDLDLSTDYNPTLEKNKIYLIKPDEANPANNIVQLPSGSEGCSLTIVDSNLKFDQYPVTVYGDIDGYTGIRMNVKHAWMTFLYSTEDEEFKTQDPY